MCSVMDRRYRYRMKYEDWVTHWGNEKAPFHVQEPDEVLLKNSGEIFGDEVKKVFVPLCGKTPDMLWMYNQGHSVVGVEIAEKALADFFKENKLEAHIETIEGVGKLYKTKDDRLKLYAANIFNITLEEVGTFDVIWDSAGLSVIDKQDRLKYFALMESLMKPNTTYFITGSDYDSSVWPGPPHPMNMTTLSEMLGEKFNIAPIHEMNLRESDWGVVQGEGQTDTQGGGTQSGGQASTTQEETLDSFDQIHNAISKSSYLMYRYFSLTFKEM